ncbi:cation:proton antiporter [Pseudomonas matsuisoli]|uniref:Transporter n=1 Tax=Pseudomonas matsuisoli TaxID=1515666 RepID=A0A917PVM0_9PSED|nr:sodium:proton antiporter [Pseudomonas matsuisoli]GGJ93210.1 transporter [Pseudomonas matsuisoli]
MTFIQWMGVLGILLLVLALASAFLRWLPVTTSILYLAFGIAIGSMGFAVSNKSFSEVSDWLEHLTEVAVLASLFVGGLKLRLPLRHPAWVGAYLMAGPVMLLCIGGVALIGHYVLGFDWGIALLIGAILAPTDPVLASLVQVNDARDDDRMRFALSGEAGFNDGVAFPFVMLGLFLILHGDMDRANWIHWFSVDLLWAVIAGLGCGFLLGKLVGWLAIRLRARYEDTGISANDFLALALIALSYVCAELIGGWGFLATFAAGVGLRHAEVRSSSLELPAEELTRQALPRLADDMPHELDIGGQRLSGPNIAAGVMMSDMLSLGNLLERAVEVLLVTILGILVTTHWDWRALPLAAALFCVIRPVAVALVIPRCIATPLQKGLMGWFGIRGIGSLYYLCFALNHDLPMAWHDDIANIVLSTVALSICVHGLSTQPLLGFYERRLAARANDG